MSNFSFTKQERLCNKRDIASLFEEGQSLFAFPIKCQFIRIKPDSALEFPCKAVFTVPKRLFKKAVDRNSLKRKMKEVYRLNKHELYHSCKESRSGLHMMFLYVAKEKLPYKQIDKSIKTLIVKLS